MNKSTQEPNELPPTEAKSPWERPTLTFLGDIKDLVQGTGKLTGPENDMDMTNIRKSPGQG